MTDPLEYIEEAETEADRRRARLRAFISEVLDLSQTFAPPPVMFSNLEVNFEARTVKFKGRTIAADPDKCCLVFPVLSTDQMIVTKDGTVIR